MKTRQGRSGTVMKIAIATSPFGKCGREPLDRLEKAKIALVHNPFDRRLKPGEVENFIADAAGVIAGTEPYTPETLRKAKNLKVISRVGIGLDSVDMKYCRNNGIIVTYTPDAPSQAVAELTVAEMLNLARHIYKADRSVREGVWNRFMGRLMHELTIGIIGVGRIGTKVIHLLERFEPCILANDTSPDVYGKPLPNTKWCSADDLLRSSDLVSLHIPLNSHNYHYLTRERIAIMKTDAFFVNTSRGKVVDEKALTDALLQGHLGGAALDVFEKEPYEGPLAKLDNVILTTHIGASARAARFLMELGAAEDCIRVLKGEKPKQEAPKEQV